MFFAGTGDILLGFQSLAFVLSLISPLHPPKVDRLDVAGGLTQVCQSLGNYESAGKINAMEEIAAAINTAVLCIAYCIFGACFSYLV
jgi:hypothetical protein